MAEKRRKRTTRRVSEVETATENLPAPSTDMPQMSETPSVVSAASEAAHEDVAVPFNEEIETEVEQPRTDDMTNERRFSMSTDKTNSTTEGALTGAGQSGYGIVVGKTPIVLRPSRMSSAARPRLLLTLAWA
jgi:hypothetical protein